jgi:endonuclease/exonuclease/phosphatase family metal-dependent hydrolase
VNGAHFIFADTHLEVGGGSNEQARGLLGPLQEGQAKDLVNMLGAVSGPVVLVGDFNSAANGSTTMSYATVASKFTDAYAKANPGMPGYTCCSDITAPQFTLGERIDIVFYRGGVNAQSVEVIGTDPSKRSPAGLWPSDHAGVVATLAVPTP